MSTIDIKEIKKRKEEEKRREHQEKNSTYHQEFEEDQGNGSGQESEKRKEGKLKKKKSRTLTKIIFCLVIIFLIAGTIFSSESVIEKSNNILNKISVVGQIRHLVESSDRKIKGEEEDRINILLLGIDDEADLSDTIIIASIKPSVPDAALISIPRDLTVPLEGYGRPKINAVHAFAERQEEGSGGRETAQTIEDVFGIPIHYYATANFQGFVNIVDRLGGLDIYVEETLEDHRYPIKGREEAEDYYSRFQHLYIEKGWQHMDGSLALKYARSRHGTGSQGSDFARARRQQQILSAMKENFESTNLLLKPSLIIDVMRELGDHVSTDMEVWEMIRLWNITKELDPGDIRREVLEPGPDGLLRTYVSTSTGYILLPKESGFQGIKHKIENIFSEEREEDDPVKTRPEVDGVVLEIRNGTWVEGLAGRAALDLEEKGFEIAQIGNSSKKDFEKSVIYDLTFGAEPRTLEILKEETGANISFDIPDWLKERIREDVQREEIIKKPDFLLILGESASEKY